MTSGGNTLSKTERLSGKKSVSTLLADGRWGAHGHFRYCWMARPSHSGGATIPGRILVSVPKRFFKRAVKRNLLKRRIREAYRIRKMAGVDILFQYNSADLADFAAIQADIAAILSRIQSAMASTTPAGRKTPQILPEQSETAPAGRKMPEFLPEQSENTLAGRKMPEILPEQSETAPAGRKTPQFLPEQSETAPADRKMPQILSEQSETASAGRKTPEFLPEQ